MWMEGGFCLFIFLGIYVDEDFVIWNVDGCCNKGKEKLENYVGVFKILFFLTFY